MNVTNPGHSTHRVFSYGTLRQAGVQQHLYGRSVETVPDQLYGFRLDWIIITDPEVIEKSGKDTHPILVAGLPHDRVEGAYLVLNDEELAQTDAYEVEDYTRVEVVLASGVPAYAYIAAE